MKEESRKRVLKPLAASTYLIRNWGKSVPLTGAVVLAVLLIAGIVSMMDSIPYSIRTIYGYAKESLIVGPRGDPDETDQIVHVLKTESPVPIERIMKVRTAPANVRSIVGLWPFAVAGLEQADMKYFLTRQKTTQVVGRLPKAGAAEALVSEPVSRNLHLKLGSTLLSPKKEDFYSPHTVKVVGIAETDRWFMISDIEYLRENHFPPIDIVLAFAPNLKQQDKLDHWAYKRFDGQRAQVFAYYKLDQQTKENFAILYQVLNVVIGTLVVVVTFMMGMLMNIYQGQRLVEFGLLQAIGYTRGQLLSRVIRETAVMIAAGWVLGTIGAFAMLHIVKAILMDPHAYALDPLDAPAYLYTVPVPLAIFAVGTLTVIFRFLKFDPVGVVERRLV